MTITVLSISASGKSAFVSVSKTFSAFASVTKGFLALSGTEPVAKGQTFELPDSTKVSTTDSISPEDPEVVFTWITLS